MKVVIVGKGAWGKALYSVISQNTKAVSFWERETEIVDADVIVLAIPTLAIRSVLSCVKTEKLPIVVNSSKGVEPKTHLLPFEIVGKTLGEQCSYFSLLGPGFADEVLSRMPTLVNLAYLNKTGAEDIARLFRTDYFRVTLSSSLRAIELASAFKNIYAIAAGVADGLGFGMNTRSMLITIALKEFYIVAQKLEFPIDRSAHPAILGDLLLTCSSTLSRNFTFGKLLVEYSPKDALKKISSTVEGYSTVSSLDYFLRQARVDLPLARFVSEISRQKNHANTREQFLEFIQGI